VAGAAADEGEKSELDEEKFIVKNKDTGEVYDIRDLASLPVESYTIFPSELAIPQDEDEVRQQYTWTSQGIRGPNNACWWSRGSEPRSGGRR